MAIFIRQIWNGYSIKLIPSDQFRKELAMRGLEAGVIYFTSTPISFDLRMNQIKDKNNKAESISYQWWLYKHNTPVFVPKDTPIIFTKSEGKDIFEFSITKDKGLIPKNPDTVFYNRYKIIGNRKSFAINVGRIKELDRYSIMMMFTTKSGINSPMFEMAEFTVFDRDVFIRYYILSALAIITTAIIAGILKGCGVG